MYDQATRDWVLGLRRQGVPKKTISRWTGVSRAAIRDWEQHGERPAQVGRCFRCRGEHCSCPSAYAYLLGQYLGDGYLVTSVRVPKLRVACAQAYPDIATEVDTCMALISGNKTGFVRGIGCDDHYSYWMHWPCMFPQHGPGMKHTRPIVLADWQQHIVNEHTWSLIRGLIHSDGCRSVNRVVVRGVTYRYPRYLFSNKSLDILKIMGDALDRAGVAWRYNRWDSISVARRDAVALMDEHIGPKT